MCNAPFNPNYAFLFSSFITSNCKNPDIAFRLFDMFYNKDVVMLKEKGIENRDWRWAKEGEQGYAGPGIWKNLVGTAIAKNSMWSQNGNYIQDENFRIGEVVDPSVNPQEKMLYEATRDNYKPYFTAIENEYPIVLHTKDESAELAILATSLSSYVNEMTARFVTGNMDINSDSDWDTYLKQLDNLNLKKFIALKQAAYDRTLQK